MDPVNIPIFSLIPQRPPVVMIDQLVYADEKQAKGRFFIKESNIFCENGFFREPGLIEFIAQTAAAHTGFYQLAFSKEVSEGYIGAVKNLILYSLPRSNSEILSEIVIDSEIMGYTIILGKVFQEDKKLAECEMRIIVRNKIDQNK